MSDKNKSSKSNLNIGKNTRWDEPKVDPKAGQTIRRPSTGLDPNRNSNNKD